MRDNLIAFNLLNYFFFLIFILIIYISFVINFFESVINNIIIYKRFEI